MIPFLCGFRTGKTNQGKKQFRIGVASEGVGTARDWLGRGTQDLGQEECAEWYRGVGYTNVAICRKGTAQICTFRCK